MKKFVMVVVICLLLSSFSQAKGGGGGSGSSSIKTPYSDLICDDAGKISFSRSPNFELKVIKPDGKEIKEVPGNWEKGIFISNEGLFKNQGEHVLVDPKLGDKKVTCPGFKFACSLVDLGLKECLVNNEKVNVKFSLQGEGSKVAGLNFQFKKNAGSIKYKWGEKGFITKKENDGLYSLEGEITDVNSVQVSYPGCIGQYYVYSRIKCVDEKFGENNEIVKEQNGKKLKCGGYMDIHDRVKCRLRLRESQEDEYENFYPEYCRVESEDEKEECIELYKSAQICWKNDLLNDKRGSCFKSQLNLGDLHIMRNNCVKQSIDNNKCLKEFEDKICHLIILRLYSLEEEAERLLDADKLSENLVVEFIVKVEELKVKFEKAEGNKQEMKKVVLEARSEWIKLVRQIE